MKPYLIIAVTTLTLAAVAPARVVSFGGEPNAGGGAGRDRRRYNYYSGPTPNAHFTHLAISGIRLRLYDLFGPLITRKYGLRNIFSATFNSD